MGEVIGLDCDDAEDQYRMREPDGESIAGFYGHYDPRPPMAAFLLFLIGIGLILALIAEFTRPGGH